MTPLFVAGTAAIVLGIAIGSTGVGGVLLVPILTLVLGIDVKRAIAAALLSYLPGCGVAVVMYARRGSIVWRDAWPLCVGALPAAWAGAWATRAAPAELLKAAIGVLLLAGGLYALRPPNNAMSARRHLGSVALLGLGGVTAFVSALTGAGGAFVLLPMLLLLDMPILPAIGLGQAIALPIAGLASVANVQAGLVDGWLAAVLAAALSVGIAVGTPIAHALPQLVLRRLLGGVVVVAGASMLTWTAMRWSGGS